MLEHRPLWWTLGAALLAVIAALSLLPLHGPDLELPNSDKLNHALAYTLLMLYFGQLARRRLLAAAGLLAFGVGIELLQSMLPARSAELADLAANLVGMLLGAALLRTACGRTLRAIEARLPRRRSR